MNISVCVPLYAALAKAEDCLELFFYNLPWPISLEAKLQNNVFMQMRDLSYHRAAIKREEKLKCSLDLEEGYYKLVICLLLDQTLSK